MSCQSVRRSASGHMAQLCEAKRQASRGCRVSASMRTPAQAVRFQARREIQRRSANAARPQPGRSPESAT
eukprot:1449928-Alexandrium_andersonii.AAC.1